MKFKRFLILMGIGIFIFCTCGGGMQIYAEYKNMGLGNHKARKNLDMQSYDIDVSSINAKDVNGLFLLDDGNNGIFIEDGGQIGIGTINPEVKLDVSGSGNQLQISGGTQNYLFADSGNGVAIQGQTSGLTSIYQYFTKDGDTTDDLRFEFFGLGTPGSTINRERLMIKWDASDSWYEISTEADGTGTLRPINTYTEGNSGQVYLSTNGNVGVGTTNPVCGLDVEAIVGNTNAAFGSVHPVYCISNGAAIGFGVYYNSGWKFGKGMVSKYGGIIDIDKDTGNMRFFTTDAGNTDAVATRSEKIRILQTGNVGIGDITPQAELDIAGEVALATDLDTTSSPAKAGIIGIDSSFDVYVSTGTGIGAWVKIGSQ